MKGKDALDPTAPFNEKFTLQINSNYLVRSLEVEYIGDPLPAYYTCPQLVHTLDR